MSKIKNVTGREIKDCKGNNALEVELETAKGIFKASVGGGDPPVNEGIEFIRKNVEPKLVGNDPANQKALDGLLIDLAGNGGGSDRITLLLSIAILRATAFERKIPLFRYVAELSENNFLLKIPAMSFNFFEVINRDEGSYGFEEFLVLLQKKLMSENLVLANKIFSNLKEMLKKNYGRDFSEERGGGFVLPFSKAEQVLYLLKNTVDGLDAGLAVAARARGFFKNGKYFLDGRELSRRELADFYKELAVKFKIVFLEDPFSREDIEGFKEISGELTGAVVAGLDFSGTDFKKMKELKSKNVCNGISIRLNRADTVTGLIEAVKFAKSCGWKIIIGCEPCETADDFIADFAVGVGADFIKLGSPSCPEIMVKYRRLIEIESALTKK